MLLARSVAVIIMAAAIEREKKPDSDVILVVVVATFAASVDCRGAIVVVGFREIAACIFSGESL